MFEIYRFSCNDKKQTTDDDSPVIAEVNWNDSKRMPKGDNFTS